jgi:hypothetical protein
LSRLEEDLLTILVVMPAAAVVGWLRLGENREVFLVKSSSGVGHRALDQLRNR